MTKTESDSRRFSLVELTVGLALGLVVGLGLISWLAARGVEGARAKAAEQRAVVTVGALVDLVEETRAGEGDVQAAVLHFAEADPGVDSVRVIDLKKRQLLASTLGEDRADDLPRRLRREEKELFDRTNELRASVETNRAEGAARKDEVLVEPRDDGGLALSVPLEEEGEVRGAVLVATPAAEIEPAAVWFPVLPWLTGALAVFLLLGFFLRGRGWVPALVAGVVALLAFGLFRSIELSRLVEERRGVESSIAAHIDTTAEKVRSALGTQGLAAMLQPIDWDVDRFRQPRGAIGGEGEVLFEEVDASFASARSRFGQAFWWIGGLGLLLAAYVGLGWAARTWAALKRHREAYSFIAPAMIGMLVLVFFPFGYGIILSFTDQTLYNIDQPLWSIWNGFGNYVDILTDFEIVRQTESGRVIDFQNFYYTLFFTIIWTVTNVAIGVSVGLALALTLNVKDLKFKPIYRVLLILPWAVPNYITALIWKGMFQQQFGVINQVIQIFGGEPIAWFDSPVTSFFTILTTNGWLSFPFMMVVALGALQSIPSDLYEAARVDGASRWQQFYLITLPSLKPAMVPAIILSVVWTFNMFNIPYLVSAGEPGGGTEILITGAYKIAFEQYRYGYSAAYSTIIFAILLVYGYWQNRVTQASEGI